MSPGRLPVQRVEPEGIHVTSSDWASLIDTLASQQQQIGILQTGHRTIVDQIAQVTVTLRRQDDAIQDITDSVRAQAKASAEVATTLQRQDLAIEANQATMKSLAAALAENTQITRGIHEAVIAGRFIRKVGGWIAAGVLAAAMWWDQIRTLLKLTKGGP